MKDNISFITLIDGDISMMDRQIVLYPCRENKRMSYKDTFLLLKYQMRITELA